MTTQHEAFRLCLWFLPFAFCLLPCRPAPLRQLAAAARASGADRRVITRVGVNERDNSTPAIVARDQRVVVTWSAAAPEGGTDIFAAVSEDGGATFHAPVRVNDLEQQARANGEQPPRAAIGPREIAVVWNTRRDGLSEVRMSRSTDGGRSFGASTPVHAPGLSGARGWTAIAATESGAFDVAWLDGRNAAVKPAPVAAAPSSKPGTGSAGPSRPWRGVAPGSLSRAFRTRRDANRDASRHGRLFLLQGGDRHRR